MRYIFADCVLDTALATLHRAGRAIPLRPKVFHLLQYLLEQRAHLVAKDVLCAQVWPGQSISDAALEGCIKLARQALGDSGQAQRLIQTRRGYGYRFVGVVEEQEVGHRGLTDTALGGSLVPPAVSSPEPAPVHSEPILPGGALGVSSAGAEEAALRRTAPDTADGERKLVTLLGCTLAHTPALRDRLGLDGLHSRIRTLYALAQREVQQYGGTLYHVTGDRLLAIFGAPVAQEDHARRAALAACGLRQRLTAYQGVGGDVPDETLRVSMGVHTGLLIIGGMEENPGASLAVVGDLPLVVEALQAGAAPGTILCSEATARLVRDVVRLEAVLSVPMPGRSHPLSTYTILGTCPPSVPLTLHGGRARSGFVGRARELALLYALLAQAEAGHGQVMGIVGEPGIGKSRLLMEWRQQLHTHGVASLAGRGLSYGSTAPYLPVLDLLREHCGITPADGTDVIPTKVREGLQAVGLAPDARAPALLHLLGAEVASEPGGGVSPETLKAQAFETLWQLCLQRSQQRSLVIAVDDLHWSDPTSEEFFALLVERLPGAAILFVGTYRPGYQPSWLGKSYASQVPLPPLSAQDSAEVIRTMCQGEPVPAALAEAILAKAQGNPFFLEELAQTVVEQGAAGGQTLPLPLTVQGVLAARLDRLPQEARHLVQYAAVIGTHVPVPLLQAIAALPEAALQRALAHLQAAEFLSETRLVPEWSYTFKHTLTQEVVYESLLQERRCALHAGIVEALEQLAPDRLADQVEQLAYHAVRGEVWDKALTYSWQAGVRAYDRAAFRTAVTCFEQALTALAQFPERRDTLEQAIDLRLDLRHALQTLDEQARVFDRLREAEVLAERLGDDRRLGQVVRHLAFYFSTMGEYGRTIAACQRALALATSSDAFDVQVAVQTTLSRAYYSGGDFRQALDIARRTITLLTGEQRSANFGRGNLPAVVSRVCMAGCLAELGSFAEGRSVAEDAVWSAEAAEQLYYIGGALLLAGVLYRRQGDVRKAIAALERSLALCQTADSPRLFPAAASLLSAAYAMAGRAAEALPLLDQTLARVVTASYTIFYTTVLTELSEALRLVGRVDEAGALAGRLLELSRTHPGRGYQAHAYRLLGEVAAQRHPPQCDQAGDYYYQALALAAELGMRPLQAHCHRGLGTLYAKTGQAEQARTALSTAMTLYRAMDMTFWLPQTEAALAAVGGACDLA